jgi:hypothetical protein
MTREQLTLLREWVRAEIEYAIECREEDSGGYRVSVNKERDYADTLFERLVSGGAG